ncbi:hypothetical protein ACFV16_35760 [Streptomyces massasporeus]|uniref:hypothetical protein n=1 Tax=Streptomyces massasporeus TaxID=67324 RepID=UPI0036C7EC88
MPAPAEWAGASGGIAPTRAAISITSAIRAAQGRQRGLRGVAVHAKLLGDPGRSEGWIVQELRDARREQIAGPWSPAPSRPRRRFGGVGVRGA